MQRIGRILRVVAIILSSSTAWPIHAIAPFQDVPAEEAHVGDGIPKAGTLFDRPSVFGRSDSHVVVVDLEDFKVVARHSANQGTTFDPGVLLAGGMGQPDAEFFRVTQGLDGTVYVALAIVDPLGGIGLQVARTLDIGQSWSAPVDVIRHGNPLHDIVPAEYRLVVAAGAGGRVAVLFANEFHGRHYVVSSADYGQTWTTPVRVDPGASVPQGSNYFTSDIAIAPNGSIHVVYVQTRGATKLLYTRSTDGGVTFEAERAINTVAFPTYPDMEIASDGGVLIAQPTSGTMVVLRSTNDGVSFGASTLADGDSNRYRTPVIRSAPGTAEVFLACPSQLVSDPPAREGPLRVWRSTDNGATFSSAPVDLASRVYRGATVAIQRTPSGAWAVAWMDTQADTYAYVMADVKVAVSLDGGATWGAARQVHSGTPGSSARTLLPTGMAASGGDELVFAWTDGRDDNSRSCATYLNRASAHALAFGADWRLAPDTSLVNTAMIDPDITTDGVSHVYTVFGAVGNGPFPEIYVAVSSDSGHTFAPAVRLPSGQGGSVIAKLPKVLARPDGHVYVLSHIETAFGSRWLSVNHSNDYGATWSALPPSLGPAATPCPPTILCGDPSLEDPQFVLGPPGKLYVSWTDRTRIYVSRSFDDGATFTTVNVSPSFDFLPNFVSALCAHGNQVVAAYIGYDSGVGDYFPFGTVSPNGGVSWSAPVRLSSTLYGADYFGGLTCAGDSNGEVLVAWSAFAANERIFFNRWNGFSWGIPGELPAPPGQDLYIPSALITSASHVLVTYASSQLEVYASRSNDGGHSFATYQRLDDATPVPGALSSWPYAATDGQGRVWVAWFDFSSGLQGATAIRFSADDGATFGPAYRLNRNEPQGGRYHFGFWLNSHVATLPGVAFAAYPAESGTRRNDIFVNAFDPGDFDRDFAPAASDCNDSDPGAKAIPAAVAALRLSGGGTVLSWTSQSASAGSGTVYDVVTGAVSELRADGSFARAVCLASGVVGTGYLETRTSPGPDEGIYYLVRAANGCGLGTLGESSAPRDALDASGICP